MNHDEGKESLLRARQITVAEAAVRLGLKPSTIRKLILTRRIGYRKIGRAVRIPEAELERLIRAGYRPPV